MRTETEVKGGASAVAGVEASEEESLLMEGVAVLDFDMLCSTVAMQAHNGKWGKLNDDNEEENFVSEYQNGGGVFRMWEGEIIYDCFDDRRVALQSTCCPCYRFGKNMKRAGFGSCFLQDFHLKFHYGLCLFITILFVQTSVCLFVSLLNWPKKMEQIGSIHLILAVAAMSNMLAFIFTRRRCFLYLAILFTVSVGTYIGFYRTLIRKKFNIKGSDSSFDDCVYHLICPSCTLCQESRTLEMNNVQDGIWHGRGDTICIGTVSTKSPEYLGMQKDSNHS